MTGQSAGPPAAHWVKMLVILAITGGAAVVAWSFAHLFAAAWDVIVRMQPGWLVAALGCEVVAYAFRALHVRYVVRASGQARRAAPIRTALVFFGLGSVLPAAPLEAFAMIRAALRRRRLDGERIALVLGFAQWFSVRSIFALAALDALVAVALSHVPAPFAMLAVLAATSWLATRRRCAELVALVALRISNWRDYPTPSERRAQGAAWHDAAMDVAGRRIDRIVLVGTCAVAWAADGLCLYFALRATGADVGLDVLLLAYSLGIIASMVPLLPAGIGVVETVTPVILHAYGVPLPTALAAVLGFRMLATVLPAVAGTVALAGLRVGRVPAAT